MPETVPYGTALEEPTADPESAGPGAAAPSDETSSAESAISSAIISEEHALAPIAQAESTRSYLLAQTLESTRTVPVVSAKLPVEGDGADQVIGSFTYRGITYAIEPGGESVAIVAADPSRLPSDFLEAQTIVLPSVVSFDGVDSYGVSRIVDGAFSNLTVAAASAAQSDRGAAPSDGIGAGADGAAPEEDLPLGITAITVPASVTAIEDDAFAGFETLQYVIVSDDNPNYSMYDGCLYDEPLASLLLIPEGRLGAVRVPSTAVTIPEDVVSHCAYVTSFIVEPDSAASQLLEGDGFHNANGECIVIAYSVPDVANGMMIREGTIESNSTEAHTSLFVEDIGTVAIGEDGAIDLSNAFRPAEEQGSAGCLSSIAASTPVVREGNLRFSSVSGDTVFVLADMRDGIASYSLVTTKLRDKLDNSGYIATYCVDGGSVPGMPIVDDDVFDDRSSLSAIGLVAAIKLGERDAEGNPVGKGGSCHLKFEGTTYNFITSSGGTWADITWTGGGDQPAAGSIVNVNMLKLDQTGWEGTVETMKGFSLDPSWGGSAAKELAGLRNPDTGSFISVESLQGAGAFTFSFVMPSSGCQLDSSQLLWRESNFKPIFTDRHDSVVNRFSLNAPEGEAPKWRNSNTGLLVGVPGTRAATYSQRGGVLVAPQNAIPYCEGYVFTGWYTEASGGTPAPAMTTDAGAMYYAHWATYASAGLKIGERDADGNPIGSGADCNLCFNGTGYHFVTSWNGAWADITWTGGGDQPAAGSIVNVNMLKLDQTGWEGTVETMKGFSLDPSWGGSAAKELAGLRNPDTGSFISVESLQGAGAFTFSFVMPSSGCAISSSRLDWLYSNFEPVFAPRENAAVNQFSLNAPAGAEPRWKNSNTGLLVGVPNVVAVTYSQKGGVLAVPENAIPYCEGYTFLGWYTEKVGGFAVPAKTTDSGATYYAHWGISSSTTIELGERDIDGGPAGAGGDCHLCFAGTTYNFITSSGGTWADITWTGGGDQPAAGSIVNVNMLKLYQTGWEGTVETMKGFSLGGSWGGDAAKELIGLRNPDTGSFVSVESLQGAGAFTFSFIMPSSGCQLDSLELFWLSSNFEPVFADRQEAVVNLFVLNAPEEGSPKWRNSNTGLLVGVPGTKAATYSQKGGALITPQNAIPYCDGYTFAGWYTAALGGSPAPANTTDSGATYYAHWEDNLNTCYLLTLHSNVPGADEVESGYIRGGSPLGLDGEAYEWTGRSIVSWTAGQDGSGAKYAAYGSVTGAAGEKIILYAQWDLDRYDISYDLAGGSWESDQSAPVSYGYAPDAEPLAVPDPVRAGYDFAGWTGTGLEAATLGLEIDPSANDKLGAHEAGTNLYARSYTATWAPRTYKMSFDLSFDDGSASWRDGEAPATDAYDAIVYDTPVTFPKAPARAGWIFTGWAPVEADAAKDLYAAEETVDPGNFASEQDAVTSFEAHWVKNLEVSVPLGSKDVGLSVSADLVEGTEFDVEKGASEIANLSDGELKVVSVREDVSDADALAARKANALEAFGGASSNASKVEAVSFVLRLTTDGSVPDASKEEARFPLFGSHVFETDSWRIPASSGVTDPSILRILYDFAFDYSKIAITDLKLNLEAKPISSLVFTVELVDSTEPSYSASA